MPTTVSAPIANASTATRCHWLCTSRAAVPDGTFLLNSASTASVETSTARPAAASSRSWNVQATNAVAGFDPAMPASSCSRAPGPGRSAQGRLISANRVSVEQMAAIAPP